jgi:hypothetical protein
MNVPEIGRFLETLSLSPEAWNLGSMRFMFS